MVTHLVLIAVIVILSIGILFIAGYWFKYRMHAAAFKADRNAAYFLLAEKIGEDKAVVEIATLSLQAEGFEEREILENKILDSETEKVRVDVAEAMHQYRRYY
jgi:hypothetical protein